MCSVPMRTITENGLLLAARFELADSTACFKFKPSAPNITGYAARERHIFEIATQLVQYRKAYTRKYSPGISFVLVIPVSL